MFTDQVTETPLQVWNSAVWAGKQVFASAKTDNIVHFSLESVGKSKLFCMRVSAPGIDITNFEFASISALDKN